VTGLTPAIGVSPLIGGVMTSRHTGVAHVGPASAPGASRGRAPSGLRWEQRGPHANSHIGPPSSTTSVITGAPSSSPPTISSSAPPSSSPTISTPSVTPPAQDVVDAYIAFYGLSTSADKNPANADIAQLDRYLTGKAKTLYGGVYAGMKADGVAYQGTPDAPRVKVGQILSPTFMFQGPALTALWCPAVHSAGRGLAGASPVPFCR